MASFFKSGKSWVHLTYEEGLLGGSTSGTILDVAGSLSGLRGSDSDETVDADAVESESSSPRAVYAFCAGKVPGTVWSDSTRWSDEGNMPLQFLLSSVMTWTCPLLNTPSFLYGSSIMFAFSVLVVGGVTVYSSSSVEFERSDSSGFKADGDILLSPEHTLSCEKYHRHLKSCLQHESDHAKQVQTSWVTSTLVKWNPRCCGNLTLSFVPTSWLFGLEVRIPLSSSIFVEDMYFMGDDDDKLSFSNGCMSSMEFTLLAGTGLHG